MYVRIGMPCNITRNVEVKGKRAIVTFSSSNPRTTLTCKLDQKKFETCKNLRTCITTFWSILMYIII